MIVFKNGAKEKMSEGADRPGSCLG